MLDNQKFVNIDLPLTLSTGKVYQEEPLFLNAAQEEQFTPPEYRRMRKIAFSHGLLNAPETHVFYAQAQFMAAFEDDFDFQGEFFRYFPTYQCMNIQQLRGYFSWRTKVRRGIVEKTSLSFVFVYLYELLNQVGVKSALEGFHALKALGEAYGKYEPKINAYLNRWLQDYVVYYRLDPALLAEFAAMQFDRAVLKLLNYREHTAADIFTALNSLSSYDLNHSRFYQKHAEDVINVICNVIAALSEHYGQRRYQGLCERLFGRFYSSSYYMFSGAVFYQPDDYPDQLYVINDIHKYRCVNGNWASERFFRFRGKNQQVGGLLKTIDYLMRRQYGFKSTLKAGATPKFFRQIIMQEIAQYTAARRQAALPKIEIDVAKLQQIRSTALVTQEKLIVEEDQTPEMTMIIEAPLPYVNDTGLSAEESRFMQCLLYGKPYDELLRSQGMMLSVMVDAVNERLFDIFGDTVLVDEGDGPVLLTDYVEDLKGMIPNEGA